MKGVHTVRSTEVRTDAGTVRVTLVQEDWTDLYPHMIRFTLTAGREDRMLARFRTNTYEYSPTDPLDAASVALSRAREWEQQLASDPEGFLDRHRPAFSYGSADPPADVVVIQGSARPDGNGSILATWATEAAEKDRRSCRVFFPMELMIRSCIGCYQCYNTGACVFRDDMDEVVPALISASLIVVCTPVYVNSVPGALKDLLDRCQAYHAWQKQGNEERPKRGLLMVTAGRKGEENFICVESTLKAFFANLGIPRCDGIGIDNLDTIRDVRTLPDLERRVKDAVLGCLNP